MTGAGADRERVPDVSELTRVVALDGPAGSGKSTVARRTAQALGWRFVDTGATYRAITLAVLRAAVPLDDHEAVTRAAESAQLFLDVDPWSARVELDGQDVSDEIRGPEVTAAVSAVSAVPGVRRHLVQVQRGLMGVEGAVVEGRDIATVVAPLAAVKVYLDAREDVRARRRAGDRHVGVVTPPAGGARAGGAGSSAQPAQERDPDSASGSVRTETSPQADDARLVALEAIRADIRRRDALDNQTNRLQVSEGAIHLDTSDLTLVQVVEAVVALVRDAGLIEPEGVQ
jgi:cytidylate kinase